MYIVSIDENMYITEALDPEGQGWDLRLLPTPALDADLHVRAGGESRSNSAEPDRGTSPRLTVAGASIIKSALLRRS